MTWGKKGETLHAVTLVSKEGCSLCKKVEAALLRSPSKGTFQLRVVSVADERYSEGDYVIRIPVVLFDGVAVFEAEDMDFEGQWIGKLEETLARLAVDRD